MSAVSLVARRLRAHRAPPTSAAGGGGATLRLHLGCGPYTVDGWENVDKSPSVLLAHTPTLRRLLGRCGILGDVQTAGFPTDIVYADVARRLPYPDGCAAFVYSSHLVEHLSRWQAVRFVRECARVLAPGGLMRVCTPDLRGMAATYLAGEVDPRTGWSTPADAFMADVNAFSDLPGGFVQRFIRRQFSGAIHQWLYDAESLALMLEEGGLGGAVVRSFRVGELPDLHVLETRPVGLFMEVRRSLAAPAHS